MKGPEDLQSNSNEEGVKQYLIKANECENSYKPVEWPLFIMFRMQKESLRLCQLCNNELPNSDNNPYLIFNLDLIANNLLFLKLLKKEEKIQTI